jgi:hypothetical protein
MNLAVQPETALVIVKSEPINIIRVSERTAAIATSPAVQQILKQETPVRFVHSDIQAVIVRESELIDGGEI